MKTSRTGFSAERPELRKRYEEARRDRMDDAAAIKASAKGLPRHMVADWTRDLCRQFDELQEVYAALRSYGPIERVFYAGESASA